MIKHLRVSIISFIIALIVLLALAREMDINYWIMIPLFVVFIAEVVFFEMIFKGLFKPVDYFINRIRLKNAKTI